MVREHCTVQVALPMWCQNRSGQQWQGAGAPQTKQSVLRVAIATWNGLWQETEMDSESYPLPQHFVPDVAF